MRNVWKIIKSPGAMALLAILSFGFAIFQQFIEKKPEILVKTEAVSSVFSVLQPVGGLQISYAGQDLRSSKQALWVLSAVISNDGAAGIRKTDYDDAAPLSISVLGGQIVETPTITSENSYLQKNLNPIFALNRITFSPVIFEPKDAFRLRALVLGPDGSVPSLKVEAKIAGLQGIRYVTPDAPYANKSTWEMITQADVYWIQPLRFIVYFIGGFLAILIMALAVASLATPFTMFSTWQAKQRRTRRIKEYRQGENIRWEDRALSEIYIEHGEKSLGKVKQLIDKSSKRLALIDQLSSVNTDGHLDQIIKDATPFYASPLREKLAQSGLLSFEGIRPKWAEGVQSALQNISAFLSIDLEAKLNEDNQQNIRVFLPSPMNT